MKNSIAELNLKEIEFVNGGGDEPTPSQSSFLQKMRENPFYAILGVVFVEGLTFLGAYKLAKYTQKVS